MQKLILVVDDNSVNLTVAALALENDYLVLTMPSAKRMFALLEKKQPDLILLDIEMPEISGFEAIAKLKEHPVWKDIPVIFLTGWGGVDINSRALEMGALEVLFKPFEPSALRDCVKKYIKA